jgi:hypothetical protein
MTETRVLRTLAVPLAIAVIFLVFTPRLCSRAISKQHPVVLAPSRPAASGLVISSSTPAPLGGREIHLPPGLEAARIQYLVEINPTFAAPMTMAATDLPVTKILLERHYIELRPDGTLGPTREGLINVNGAVDSPNGWMVPVGQRKFLGIDAVDDTGDGQYNVTVRWRWEPTSIGASLLPRPQDHHLKAQFAGGERNWVLARYVDAPDRDFR